MSSTQPGLSTVSAYPMERYGPRRFTHGHAGGPSRLPARLQGVRFVTPPAQLLRGDRAGGPAVAEGDHPGALGQLEPLHGPLVAGLQGVVGVEVDATRYRALPVLFPLADVHDRDPLAALQHIPQCPRVDVLLRPYPATCSLALPPA